MRRIEIPITLLRRGDSVALALPKKIKDLMEIEPDQDGTLRIRETADGWRVSFIIPKSSDTAEPEPSNPATVT